jgi:hypothetical protein
MLAKARTARLPVRTGNDILTGVVALDLGQKERICLQLDVDAAGDAPRRHLLR